MSTVGTLLRETFANSSDIPPAIAQHFNNATQLSKPLKATHQNLDHNNQASSENVPKSTTDPTTDQEGFDQYIIQQETDNLAGKIDYNELNQNAAFAQDPLAQFDLNAAEGGIPPSQETHPAPNMSVASVDNNNNNNVAANNNAANTNMSIITTNPPAAGQYSDITDYLNMQQNQAAKKLGIPPSTLSKRWREAAPNRKWPWRTVCKIDKEITTLLHNIPPDGVIPKDIEEKLSVLIAKRQEELKPIVIRL